MSTENLSTQSVSAVPAQRPDQRFDDIIGLVLRTGVLIAAFFVLIGGVMYLLRENGPVPNYHVFHSEPAELRSVPGILHAAAALQAPALIQFGLLVLIATPVARVILSVVVFAYERDRIYVLVTVIVLGLLLYSLFGRHP